MQLFCPIVSFAWPTCPLISLSSDFVLSGFFSWILSCIPRVLLSEGKAVFKTVTFHQSSYDQHVSCEERACNVMHLLYYNGGGIPQQFMALAMKCYLRQCQSRMSQIS